MKLAVFLACLAGPAGALPAQDETFLVTNLHDGGDGSLRVAVEAANARAGADRIRFAHGVAGEIPVVAAPLLIRDALRIEGPGGRRIRLRGDGERPIVRVGAEAVEVTLDGLHFSAAGDSAIVNEGALLAVRDSTLQENTGRRGGAIASYGGDLRVERSLLRGNRSETIDRDGGGIGGGIYAANTSVTIEATRISSNQADALGGGVYAELPSDGTLLVRDSVVDANSATTQGGGLFVLAGGGPPSRILNSTLSGNRSTRNAAIWFDGAVVVGNSTVAYNRSLPDGIGGHCPGLCGAGGNSTLWLTSSLLAGNRDTYGSGYDLAPIAGGTHVSHSLIERATRGAISDDRGGNLFDLDPRLDASLDPSASLPTHALAADSPAIDAGVNPHLLHHDQRGRCHPRTIGAATDIGAHEHAPADPRADARLCLPVRRLQGATTMLPAAALPASPPTPTARRSTPRPR